ncbi:cytochrome P450 [Roridomyces roridus]|uniref:Cytochrome P450 n=1 Tax=Roridomyces roridus TaxID=1738132 RepID=A0AAD7B1J2_9AGAR|nr:cytochrome P450 [Roridomyces roridus]
MLLDPINSILLVTVLFTVFLLCKRRRLPLPPGPPKFPLLGNVFNHPSVSVWKVYMEWSKLYGKSSIPSPNASPYSIGHFTDSDIIHVDIAGRSIVILSSLEAAVNLLDKRSAIYSDRPRLPMVNELMGWDSNFCMPVDTSFSRIRRRLFHSVFHAEASREFRPEQLSTIHRLLLRLLHEPEDIMAHFRHMTGSLILGAAYGINVAATGDPYVKLAEEAVASVTEALVPGRFLVDSLPLLKYIPSWFPGAGFQHFAREGKKLSQNLLEKPFAEAKRKIESGNAPYSFTAASLQNLEEFPDKEQAIKDTAAVMYGAGTDTIVSALGTFVLAMFYNPEAQRKAQAEIDSVIKQGHLPDFDDEPYLPHQCQKSDAYVSALVREVLRWQPVTPLGVAHFIVVEDEYKGYRIPRGSTVMTNTWAILHDKNLYPDPYAFKPERFLLNGKLNPATQGPEAAAFGFGRRICPGRHMAASSIWITITSILATFDITKAVGKDGELVEPSYEYFERLVVVPRPFECSIKPRSKDAQALIQSTADQDCTT